MKKAFVVLAALLCASSVWAATETAGTETTSVMDTAPVSAKFLVEAHGGIKALSVNDSIMTGESKGNWMYGLSAGYNVTPEITAGLRFDYTAYTDTNTQNKEIKVKAMPLELFGNYKYEFLPKFYGIGSLSLGWAFGGKYSVGTTEYKASTFTGNANLKAAYAVTPMFMPYMEGGYQYLRWGANKLKLSTDENVTVADAFNFGGLYTVAGLMVNF